MRRLCSLFVLLGLPLVGSGQSLTLPPQVAVPVPGLVIVRPSASDGDDFAWFSLDAGLQLIPSDLLAKKDSAAGVAVAAGTYRLRAIATKDVSGKAHFSPVYEVVVVVGPPTPGPTPGPTPTPTPDPLTQLVAAAWAQEADPAKLAQVQQLAALYEQAAKATVNDPSITTNQQLLDKLHAAAEALVGSASLPKLRPALAVYLNAQLGTSPPAPVDRAKAGKVFAQIATTLEGLK